MKQSEWSVSEDCRVYTGVYARWVYEAVMFSSNSTQCLLRRRNRAWGGADTEWHRIGTYKNPATAMAHADAEEGIE